MAKEVHLNTSQDKTHVSWIRLVIVGIGLSDDCDLAIHGVESRISNAEINFLLKGRFWLRRGRGILIDDKSRRLRLVYESYLIELRLPPNFDQVEARR